MNDRLACALCGGQPCQCVEAECRDCDGEGKVPQPGWIRPHSDFYADSPSEPPLVDCEPCEGTGTIKCDGPRSTIPSCRFSFCYCEAAWERQQADYASEPPPTAAERHQRDAADRQALRSGVPL